MTVIKTILIAATLITALVTFSVYVKSDDKQQMNLFSKKSLPPLEARAQSLIQFCKQSQGQIYIEEGEKEERIGCLFMPATKADPNPISQQ